MRQTAKAFAKLINKGFVCKDFYSKEVVRRDESRALRAGAIARKSRQHGALLRLERRASMVRGFCRGLEVSSWAKWQGRKAGLGATK